MERPLGLCLINELSEPVRPKITSMKDKDRPEIDTVLQETEILNRNRRFYETSEISEQVQCKRTIELLKARSLFGEAGHPITTNLTRQNSIDLTKVSHIITDIWMDGTTVRGKIIGAKNDLGKFFSKSILDGTKVAFSLRALGIIKETAKGMKVAKPKMVTYDWVIFPSYEKAYMTGFSESASGVYLPDNYNDGKNKLIIESANYDGVVSLSNNKVNVSNKVFDYIMDESKNINDIVQQIAIDESSIQLSPSKTFISFTDMITNDKYIMPLEKKVTNDLLDYFGEI